MDTETLQKFLEEAESYLPMIREGIMAYERDSSKIAELQASRRYVHTIKSSASIAELSEIGQIALEIEGDLKKVIQTKSALTEESASEFLSQVLVLEAHLSNLRSQLDGALKKGVAVEEIELVQIEDSPEQLADSDIEEFEIDAEMLEVFADEAEDLLRNIVTNLNVLEKTPNNREALLEIRRSAHTLKGSAGIIGLKNLSALAHRVEDLLDYLSDNEIESDKRIFELLLASADCLSALAGGDNSVELNRKIQRIYHTYDEVLANLQEEKLSVATDEPELEIIEQIESEPIQRPQPRVETVPVKPEPAEPQSNEATHLNRSVIRVSLDRLNDLFNLVGEMVISRSVFEQRLTELERQIEELHRTTQRLRLSTGKLETDFEASAPVGGFNMYRLDTEKPVKIINSFKQEEFDTLEFDRYTEFHQTTRELTETTSDTFAINTNLDNLLDNLNLLFDNQKRVIESMQENLLRLRMVSLNTLTPRLQRTVRVTAHDEGKLADLVIENDKIEIDTEILDSFIEPLIHLLRNAVAHGIEDADIRRLLGKPEKGKITLKAYSEGTHIVFVVSDDGSGISVSRLKEKAVRSGVVSASEAAAMSDEDAYSLIFLPGLSTASQLNQTSGRGVGMNIVSSNISRRQGTISIKSEPQKGTSFTIRMPMGMAVTRALLVKAGTQTFSFPLQIVKKIAEISPEEFEKARREKILTVNEKSYSFSYFNELINLPQASVSQQTKIPLILLETFESPSVLAVDQILKTEEIVIKPLGTALQNISEIIGATILGDGNVVPVLDLVYLLKKDLIEKGRKWEENIVSDLDDVQSDPTYLRNVSVLIVDDSPSVRKVNSNLIENAGWQVLTAKDGLEALEILQDAREFPDVILTDVEMPRMDGYELLALLKRQPTLCNIPVIMITSRTGEKHRSKAYDLGVNEYLTKPYEEFVLIDKIKSLIKEN